MLGPGREGIGKSLFCAWLAAQLTHGGLPGIHYGTPRSVIYAATEDSWERTIAGRLLVARADLTRMYGYWKSRAEAGEEEPNARDLAEVGGVTYDAARKALIRYRADRIPAAKSGGLAPKTVRNVHVMLTAALGDAVRWDYLPRNPAADAKPPRVPRRVGTVWTPAQLRGFIAQVEGDRFYALWLLVCTTGLRRGELAGLRRDGVDLEHGRISTSSTRVVVDGHAEDSDTKTERSTRSVALDPTTLDALRRYVRLWDLERAEFEHTGTLLFCWPDGRPIHPETISDWFTAHSIAAGLPPIRPTRRPAQLRHSGPNERSCIGCNIGRIL